MKRARGRRNTALTAQYPVQLHGAKVAAAATTAGKGHIYQGHSAGSTVKRAAGLKRSQAATSVDQSGTMLKAAEAGMASTGRQPYQLLVASVAHQSLIRERVSARNGNIARLDRNETDVSDTS